MSANCETCGYDQTISSAPGCGDQCECCGSDSTFFPNRITRDANGTVTEERLAIQKWPEWAAVGLGLVKGAQ